MTERNVSLTRIAVHSLLTITIKARVPKTKPFAIG